MKELKDVRFKVSFSLDGVWSVWSQWSCFCPRTRRRSCKNPMTQATANDCDGEKEEMQQCKSAVDIPSKFNDIS